MTTSSPRPATPHGDEPDLYDSILQRLFATGLTLQQAITLLAADPDTASARIEQAIDDLDATMQAIRANAPG